MALNDLDQHGHPLGVRRCPHPGCPDPDAYGGWHDHSWSPADALARKAATGVRSPTMTTAKADLHRQDPRNPAVEQTVRVSPDDQPLYDIVTTELGFTTTEQRDADEQARTDSHAYKAQGYDPAVDDVTTPDADPEQDKADPPKP